MKKSIFSGEYMKKTPAWFFPRILRKFLFFSNCHSVSQINCEFNEHQVLYIIIILTWIEISLRRSWKAHPPSRFFFWPSWVACVVEVRSLSPQAQSFERVRNDHGGFTRRLTEKMSEIKSDVFGQKGYQFTIDRSLISMRGTEYAMAPAADIVYNQRMFWGKRDYWFQPLCKQLSLGWNIGEHFKERFRIVSFVVCCDPNLFQDSTNYLKRDII